MLLFQPEHRQLIVFKAIATLKSESTKTYLSFMWWVIEPLLSMATYYVVFKLLLNRGTENYVAFLLIGLVTWQWFANAVSQSAASINANKDLVCQVRFPKLILPSVTILINTIKFLVTFVLLLLLMQFSTEGVSVAYFYLPIVLLVQLLLISACSYIAAIITTYVPDFQVLLPNLLRLMMFLSGIFYAVETLSPHYQQWFGINPMWVVIDSFRKIFLTNSAPDLFSLMITAALSISAIALTTLLMRRYDAQIPRVLLQR